MNVNNTSALKRILDSIIIRRPLMVEHIERIRNTEYRLKNQTLDWFPNASTTWGPYNVHLAWNFFSWEPIDQQSNLVHESTHSRQFTRYGSTFLPRYILSHLRNGYDKNRFEVEAEQAENVYIFGRTIP
jgi:hypothetical protein